MFKVFFYFGLKLDLRGEFHFKHPVFERGWKSSRLSEILINETNTNEGLEIEKSGMMTEGYGHKR